MDPDKIRFGTFEKLLQLLNTLTYMYMHYIQLKASWVDLDNYLYIVK